MLDGQALPGVNVLVKGTSNGTITDMQGNYKVTVPDEGAVLIFSFVGYTTEEIPVNGQSTIDIDLADDISSLQEVVVTALGIKREEKALGYAVSKVESREITKAGNPNFASALYGKAAGVKINTAPGGATSAVNVQIRGINSLSFNSQPLYVVDGIVIRNVNNTQSRGLNNDGYWSDQKIRGNGILDINPQDIESLTVLKGASATALYGSEAASGVVVITTKKGSKREGLGVDVNYTYNIEQVAFTPKFQNVYGPGYDRATNLANGADEDGWILEDTDGDGVAETKRPYFRAYGQFGPKMEGQMVPWWDGTTRSYSPQPDNYKDFYQTGYNSQFNAAVANQTDMLTYRLSYTRTDYEGINIGSQLQRNNFNLNSTLKLTDRISTDVIVNYVNNQVHNRPEQINRVSANYGGFFSRADDMSVYLDKYKTSEGYQYVPFNQTDRNPEEALAYDIRAYDLLNYMWRNITRTEDESQNRVISSATLNYNILDNLTFRGRVGNDFTSVATEVKEPNTYQLAFNSPNSSTGYYQTSSGRYSILYTDFLLSYVQKFGEETDLTISGGFQSREENYRDESISTRDGLVLENWFSISNSYNVLNSTEARSNLFKYAFLGIASFNYKNLWFLEGTARQEYSSTLPPGNNSFFYPSVNTSFVFSDAFDLSTNLLSFGKVRASYGVVGNAPPVYKANIVYNQTSLQTSNGSVSTLNTQSSYGNNEIRPENKYEAEVGINTRWWGNTIGLDLTYYNSRVVDQILPLALSPSTGATEILANIGEIGSSGFEVAINATPVANPLLWDTRFNFAFTNTKVISLMDGVDRLTYYNADGGAIQIVADKGERLGDIYAHPRATDEEGNFIISEDGLYTFSTEYEKVGNILPKFVGGWVNTLSYKGLSLDITTDYSIGGQLVSNPTLYATGAGMYESTLEYRDEAHGGLPYYIDGDENKVLLNSHSAAAPDGSRVYHDGIVLDGVTTEGVSNETIVDAATYYLNTYTWSSGWYGDGAVFDNSYIKLRELALGYRLPNNLVNNLGFQNIRVSLVGRNLFYFWRTLQHLDPEVGIGTNWQSQGIDEGTSAATRSFGVSINASF